MNTAELQSQSIVFCWKSNEEIFFKQERAKLLQKVQNSFACTLSFDPNLDPLHDNTNGIVLDLLKKSGVLPLIQKENTTD